MKHRFFGAVVGGLMLGALVYLFNVRLVSVDIVKALWILPAIIAWHLGQLFISACAWRLIVGDASVSRLAFFRLRVIRESMNSLIPTAQIGGPVIGAIGMAQLGIRKSLASAGTMADVIVEAGAQLIFIIVGLLLIPSVILTKPDRPLDTSLLIAAGAVLFLLAGQAGKTKYIKGVLLRFLKWVPHTLQSFVQSVRFELRQLKGRPLSLFKALGLHLASWCAGAGEVYLVLLAIGVPTSVSHAFVIESIGTAARSAGFAIPGALGFQETGLILIGGQFGLEPDAALALSVIKRLRELLIASFGFLLWQFRANLRAADRTESPTL